MKTIVIDDVVKVEYQDTGRKGQLTSIHVIFGNSGHIGSYFGPGLRLALDLLKDQFPPKTDAESTLVGRPFPYQVNLVIDPDTLVLSVRPANLKDLTYVQLMTVYEQAHHFNFFQAGGRPFNTDPLLSELQEEIKLKKPQA